MTPMIELPSDCGVACSRSGDVLIIELNQPDRRNPQSPATWDALLSIAERIPDEVSAVLLTGAGATFSAGLDRRLFTPEGIPGQTSLLALAAGDRESTDKAIAHWQRAFTVWRELPQITIALVQGHAVGAGFQLALGADLMIVADDAQLSLRETRLGLIPDLGGTAELLASVGYRRALDLCLSGRSLSADEAVDWGLAVAVTAPDAMRAHAEGIIDLVRTAPFAAARAVKALLARGVGVDRAAQLDNERAAQIDRLRVLSAGLGAGHGA